MSIFFILTLYISCYISTNNLYCYFFKGFIMKSNISVRRTVEEMIRLREKGLSKFAEVVKLRKMTEEAFDEAHKIFIDVAGEKSPIKYSISFNWLFSEYGDESFFEEKIKKEVDASLWKAVFETTTLWSFLDREAKAKMKESLQNPIEFKYEDVLNTISEHFNDRDSYIRRGLINAFKKTQDYFSREYKSHDAFKFDKKLIFAAFAVYDYGKTKIYHSIDYIFHGIQDIDRAFHIFDGKQYNKNEIDSVKLRRMISNNEKNLETEYFHIKMYRNGNLHLIFKRPDLVKKCNKEIAAYFGENVLGNNDK